MSGINSNGVAWGKVSGILLTVGFVGGVIGYMTGGAAEPPKQPERVRSNQAQSQQVVPTYGQDQKKAVEAAALTPSLPGNRENVQDKQGAAKPRSASRPPQKTYEQKLWDAHLDAGVGGPDFEVPAGSPAALAAELANRRAAMATSCVLPPTMPITMQVESAGYTERGGMLNGLIVAPVLGMGMGCVVLPVGTRVTMEFWGEPGEAEMIEIGFPTFVSPGRGAIQPQLVTGTPPDTSNSELPDHLSGWVLTPTLSLDAGDTVTLHLRGELNAIR